MIKLPGVGKGKKPAKKKAAKAKKKQPKHPAAVKLEKASQEPSQKPKHAGGRPTKYKPEYCDDMISFFNRLPYETVETVEKVDEEGNEVTIREMKVNDLPFFFEYAMKIGVDEDTLRNWGDKYPEFLGAYKKCKALQERMVKTNALKGFYKGSFAWRLGKNIFGWRDQVDVAMEAKVRLAYGHRD